ncbi:MAG: hypothetical protein HHJ13_16595, partial [Phycicoccus sp.]|nr:hypothetical protein [Phycicoccus sp.]
EAVGAKLGNYNIHYVNGSLAVGSRTLTITADGRDKTYGDTATFAGTEFTTVLGQLVNGDTVDSVTLTSDGAVATATVGPYDITPSEAVGAKLGNYNIHYVNGSLAVGSRTLTITADGRDKTYGDTLTLGTTSFTTSGLVNGNTVTGVTLSSPGAAASATVAGNPYTITPTVAVGTGLTNYAISYANGTLTVNPKPLTITADADPTDAVIDHFTKVLGSPNPPFTVRYAGFVGGEDLSNLGGTLVFATLATTASGIGHYTVTPQGLTSSNYAISFVDGTLDIVYGWNGFLQPINDTAHQTGVNESKFKLGQTIPAKFVLTDTFGNVVQQSGNPTFSRTWRGACDLNAALDSVPSTSTSTDPEYKLTGGQYLYGWSTKGLTAGEYRVFANLADGTARYVDICLTK